MPWKYEDIDDDLIPGDRPLVDATAAKALWTNDVWPWWRSLFAESSSDLGLVLTNARAGKSRITGDERLKEVQPVIEAALLMLMLDTVTRSRTGSAAHAQGAFHRNNLLNLREGDLATFIKRLQARGIKEAAFTNFTQVDLRAKYGIDDHDALHEDVIRYLFQVDLMDAELEGLWLSEVSAILGDPDVSFGTALSESARHFIRYCLYSPLRRLRVMVRASSPRVELVRQCTLLMEREEHRYWLEVLLALCGRFNFHPAGGVTEPNLADMMLTYLTGAVSRMMAEADPPADANIDWHAAAFSWTFGSLFAHNVGEGDAQPGDGGGDAQKPTSKASRTRRSRTRES